MKRLADSTDVTSLPHKAIGAIPVVGEPVSTVLDYAKQGIQTGGANLDQGITPGWAKGYDQLSQMDTEIDASGVGYLESNGFSQGEARFQVARMEHAGITPQEIASIFNQASQSGMSLLEPKDTIESIIGMLVSYAGLGGPERDQRVLAELKQIQALERMEPGMPVAQWVSQGLASGQGNLAAYPMSFIAAMKGDKSALDYGYNVSRMIIEARQGKTPEAANAFNLEQAKNLATVSSVEMQRGIEQHFSAVLMGTYSRMDQLFRRFAKDPSQIKGLDMVVHALSGLATEGVGWQLLMRGGQGPNISPKASNEFHRTIVAQSTSPAVSLRGEGFRDLGAMPTPTPTAPDGSTAAPQTASNFSGDPTLQGIQQAVGGAQPAAFAKNAPVQQALQKLLVQFMAEADKIGLIQGDGPIIAQINSAMQTCTAALSVSSEMGSGNGPLSLNGQSTVAVDPTTASQQAVAGLKAVEEANIVLSQTKQTANEISTLIHTYPDIARTLNGGYTNMPVGTIMGIYEGAFAAKMTALQAKLDADVAVFTDMQAVLPIMIELRPVEIRIQRYQHMVNIMKMEYGNGFQGLFGTIPYQTESGGQSGRPQFHSYTNKAPGTRLLELYAQADQLYVKLIQSLKSHMSDDRLSRAYPGVVQSFKFRIEQCQTKRAEIEEERMKLEMKPFEEIAGGATMSPSTQTRLTFKGTGMERISESPGDRMADNMDKVFNLYDDLLPGYGEAFKDPEDNRDKTTDEIEDDEHHHHEDDDDDSRTRHRVLRDD